MNSRAPVSPLKRGVYSRCWPSRVKGPSISISLLSNRYRTADPTTVKATQEQFLRNNQRSSVIHLTRYPEQTFVRSRIYIRLALFHACQVAWLRCLMRHRILTLTHFGTSHLVMYLRTLANIMAEAAQSTNKNDSPDSWPLLISSFAVMEKRFRRQINENQQLT